MVLFLFTFLTFVPVTKACELAITPGKAEVTKDQSLEMIAYRKQIHKKCSIHMEDVLLEATNCVIEKQSEWIKEGLLWSKKLSVSFPTPGEAFLKLSYDCEKHPGENVPFIAKIKVNEKTVEAPPKEETPPPTEETPPKEESPKEPSPKPSNPPEAKITPAEPKKPDPLPPSKEESTQKADIPPVSANQDESTKEPLPDKSETSISSNQSLTASLDPIPGSTQSINPAETTKDLPKSPFDYFFDASFFILFMLFALSMIFYLLKLFQLRLITNIISLGVLGFFLGGCICPLGLIERIGFLNAITPFGIFSLLLLLLMFLISLFFGRLYCGWICPQGALQEFLFRSKKSRKLSHFWRRIFFVLPILVFLASLLIPFFINTPVFCKVDPFKIPFQQTGRLPLLIVFSLLAGISIFFYRPFCRSICPLGFFLGVGSWLGEKLHLRIHPNPMKCTSCNKCTKTCPVDTTETYHCIECGDCHSECKIKTSKKNMPNQKNKVQ